MTERNSYVQYQVPNASDELNLGVGQPSIDYFKTVKDIIQHRKNIPNDLNIFQYGEKSGCYDFRNTISQLLATYSGVTVGTDNIYMTNGVSQAMLLLSALFKKTTRYAFVEDPTYFLMLDVLKDTDYELNTVDLKNLDKFDAKLDEIFKTNSDQNVIAYIIPFHQNPTGNTFTDGEKLAKLCDKYPNLIILSDETYQMLSFDGRSLRSMASYHKNIISLGTVSKIIAPSFRVGWIYTQDMSLIKKLNNTGFMQSGGCVNQYMGEIVTYIICRGKFQEHLTDVQKSLKKKCELLRSMLLKYPNLFEVSDPCGGYFLWVRCKKMNAEDLLKIAKKYKVSFHCGNKFSHEKKYDKYFRLSFSYYNQQDILLFEERLKNIVEGIDKFRVNVIGGNGRLGKMIVEECEKSGLTTKILQRGFDIKDVSKYDIYVDVSSPEGTKSLLTQLLTVPQKPHVIIGTTGEMPCELINAYPKDRLYCMPNFSDGVNSLFDFLKSTDCLKDYKCELTETHHMGKKDKPSGTAKRFKAIMEEKEYKNIPKIKSIRDACSYGVHEISFENEHESIRIVHIAKDRKLFALGCLKLIKRIFLEIKLQA